MHTRCAIELAGRVDHALGGDSRLSAGRRSKWALFGPCPTLRFRNRITKAHIAGLSCCGALVRVSDRMGTGDRLDHNSMEWVAGDMAELSSDTLSCSEWSSLALRLVPELAPLFTSFSPRHATETDRPQQPTRRGSVASARVTSTCPNS
jgi:hypothetical protein